MDESSEKKEANAQPVTVQRLDESKQALAEYEAAAIAIRAKTERLRALRLARDAANPPEPAAKKRKSATKKGKAGSETSGNLAAWLDEQAKQGRRS
jgi:hypothetical protein